MGVGVGCNVEEGEGKIVGAGVEVGATVAVEVGTSVGVAVGVGVGVGVGTAVGVGVGVGVGVAVGVGVGVAGLFDEPGVGVLNVTQLSSPSGDLPTETPVPGFDAYDLLSIFSLEDAEVLR